MVGKCIGGITQPHGEKFIMWLTAKPLLLIHSQTMRRSRCMCRWINEESLSIEKIWVSSAYALTLGDRPTRNRRLTRRAARLFFAVQPIISLIYGVVIACVAR